jgi:hypothetical protein
MENLLHSVGVCQWGLPKSATKQKIFEHMVEKSLLVMSAGLTFTQTVDLAVKKGLVKFMHSDKIESPYIVLTLKDD